MSTVPNGFNDVMEEADRVRSRELVYAIFTIDPVNPVNYKIVTTQKNSTQSSARDVTTKEELVTNFDSLRSQITDGKGYFIVYDFGFYKNDTSFRNVLCLFSIVPDTLKVNARVAFSTSSLQLPTMLNVAKHIPFNNVNDIVYENISRICMAHKPH